MVWECVLQSESNTARAILALAALAGDHSTRIDSACANASDVSDVSRRGPRNLCSASRIIPRGERLWMGWDGMDLHSWRRIKSSRGLRSTEYSASSLPHKWGPACRAAARSGRVNPRGNASWLQGAELTNAKPAAMEKQKLFAI